MKIRDEPFRCLAALQVLDWLARGDVRQLEEAGLSRDTITRLRESALSEIQCLLAAMQLSIRFDFRQANANLACRLEDSACLEYYVANHATSAMLRKYFHLHSRRAIDAVYAHRNCRRRIGRTPVVDDKTVIRVFEEWSRLSRQVPDERRRYILLHKAFPQWPISSLYSAINGEAWEARPGSCKKIK